MLGRIFPLGLGLLILVATVVHDLANGRSRVWRHLDEIEVLVPGPGQRFVDRNDADLFSTLVDQTYRGKANLLVDPRFVCRDEKPPRFELRGGGPEKEESMKKRASRRMQEPAYETATRRRIVPSKGRGRRRLREPADSVAASVRREARGFCFQVVTVAAMSRIELRRRRVL
jgi:hypothetical protein